MASNFEKLKSHILPLSQANEFHFAKNEWVLFDIELHDEWDQCPCGKDIKEKCYIKNQLNGNITHVGNKCINKFIEIETGNLFYGLKLIAENQDANANEDLIIHAHNLGYIFENEYKFLMDMRGKSVFSPRQLAWKQKINRRILNKTIVRRT